MYYANLVLANTVVRLFSKYKCIPLNVENVKSHQDVPLVVPSRMTMLPDIKIRIVAKGELTSWKVESVQNFLIKMGIKPLMHLWK